MNVTVSGLRELDAQLARLKPATGKGALRRALKSVAEPLAEDMRQRAPNDPSTSSDDLVASIGVSTKLSARQQKLHRKMFRDDRASVEMFVGAGKLPHPHLQEFGTRRHAPQPFARPAWDAARGTILERLSAALRAEIDKTIARAAKSGKLRE